MGFNDRIREARLNKNLTQEQLAKMIGVAKSTLTGYEKGNREPNMLTIQKMIKALCIDANYLWQDFASFPFELTYDEMENLVKRYRSLDNYGKDVVSTILEKEYIRVQNQSIVNEEKESNIIPMRLVSYYYKNASAGTGQIIFDTPPTKQIEIPNIPKYTCVSYAIGVDGNSMQPTYSDGDTLLIEMTKEIEIGDIGIFQVDGECFVKKLGESELISLNKNHKNVPLNESASCMGKVIGKLK